MFDRAVLTLTAWYTLALLVVSLIFSVTVYRVASHRLNRSLERQTELFERIPLAPGIDFYKLRTEQIEDDRAALVKTLIRTNLTILLVSVLASYLFARRTLAPIKAAHEAQARFTADASHELRTPLATMKAEIEVALGEKVLSSREAKRVLASSLEEIDRLEKLSSQLLSLNRAEAGETHHPIDLTALAVDTVATFEKKHRIDIEATLARSIRVSGNDALLRQLLAILVENAVKYAGREIPAVEIRLSRTDRHAVLSVTDHGVGIAASDLPHVFDRFYRGRNTTKSGHGLGLAIAKEIVTRHKGTINVFSRPGETTCFTVQIPIHRNASWTTKIR